MHDDGGGDGDGDAPTAAPEEECCRLGLMCDGGKSSKRRGDARHQELRQRPPLRAYGDDGGG